MKNFKNRDFLLAHRNLVVLDVRYDMSDGTYGRKAYEKGHYKGAYFLDLYEDLAGPVNIHGGRHPLPPRESFQEKLRSFGLSQGQPVLIYDDGDNAAAGRLWWMLKYYGLKEVYVLSGGFSSLAPEDLTKEVPQRSPGDILLEENEQMTASYEEVKAYAEKEVASNTTVLVDARAKERYKGLVEPIDRMKGHIKHAQNVFFRDHFDARNMLQLEKTKENFKEILSYEDVIVHCGSGVTACTNIMALEELGKASRLYVGSFSDFISYEGNTVERD